MNIVFFVIVAVAFAVAGWRQIGFAGVAVDGSPMEALGQAALHAAEGAVTLGIGLIGTMALFLGIMKIAETAGLMRVVARLLRPLLHRLFPEVPQDHPAMGAMVMNVAANILGLSNAATPFGVHAMQQLDRLNPEKGTASDAMVLFLAINTANVTLLPTHVMALRTAIGSHDPAAVIPTTLFATLGSTLLAVLFAKWGARWFPSRPLPDIGVVGATVAERDGVGDRPLLDPSLPPPFPLWVSCLAGLAALAILPLTLLWGRVLSPWIIPSLLVGVLGYGLLRKVAVYEAFVEGAKEGLTVSLRILPYLVAILVAVGMFRESGAMDMLVAPLGRLTGSFGLPPEALSMAVLRSLSGSASFGYLAALLKDPAIGPDSYLGLLLSTIYGSSETTFYVLAVYFGAAGVKRIRHALLAGLFADLGGLVLSVLICRWVW
ncbi:nucleoside recognition domain-containing protein [Telmatospirillum sp.]|uniref:nucleoside recognition domain-containing protein n=1 Tax=Telmatospirillum sp. TaxID=2079197 RepID=UPI0028462BEC|nr:nucleoside recognition domain-containing protein [Telmatospirillum sp.]MDR3437210.1 nucleoside recognition domain-containing protein [Telmatospirillum sp.]